MGFNYQNGSQTYRSAFGACLYALMVFTTLVFAIQQSIVMYNRSATLFLTNVMHDYLDEEYSFGFDDGFMIAFALHD